MQIKKLTEKRTIPETGNMCVISAGTGLKEQADNILVKEKDKTHNSNLMFCADESKVRLKSNLKIFHVFTF